MAKPTRYTQEMIEDYTRQGLWTSETLSDIWDRNARDYPQKEALVDSHKRLTWADAKLWTDRIALNFRSMGFIKDDALIVQLPPRSELLMMHIACEKAGLLYVPAMHNLSEKEVEYLIRRTEAKGIVIPWKFKDTDYYGMIRGLQGNSPQLKQIIFCGDEYPEGALALNAMAARPMEEGYPMDYLKQTQMPSFEVTFIRPTSGTTGMPKLVELPVCCRVFESRTLAQVLEITRSDIVATISPAAGGPNVLPFLGAPVAGAKIVFLEKWDAEEALRLIERERVTLVGAVPTQLFQMIHHPNFSKYDFSSLRRVVITGQALTYKLGVEAEAKLGCPVLQLFGATEWGGSLLTSPSDSQEIRFNTVGKCSSEKNMVKIIDEDGNEVTPGEPGELLLGGPSAGSGYFKNPEATWEVWTKDGWLKTGDVARVDEAGNVVICGRKKDMIIRGGNNIYPSEIENLLLMHPKVVNVAVVSMPDPVMGEKVCAYVSLKKGQDMTLEEMVVFLKGKGLSAFKIPERLEIMDRLPLGPSGEKIDKGVLRNDIAAKLKVEGKI